MSIKNAEPPLKHTLWLKKIKYFYFLGKNALNTFSKTIHFKASSIRTIIEIEKKLAFNLLILFSIAVMPWISEVSANKQVYTDIQKFSQPIDPIKAGELVMRFSNYTPGIVEDADDVAISMMMATDNYTLSQQLAINANKTIDEPERAEATYTVQNGETMMQIAQKFDLHVASILDANGMKGEDANRIKPGTLLNIPSSDTSTSNEWLVAIKQAEEKARLEKEKALAEANKKKALALAKSKSSFAATNKQTSSGGYNSIDNSGLIVPISSRGISQYFGRGHTGIDYMANEGTPVHAAASGRVIITSSGWSGGYGNQIVVDHGGGRATRYAHLSAFDVGVGDNVSQGQTIAYSGNTGRSTGPHLHFELIINGRPVSAF